MARDDRLAENLYNDFIRGRARLTGIGGFLAKLWSNILSDLGITYNAMELKSAAFMKQAKASSPDADKQGYFNRGNLRREIIKPTMTFKVFIKVLRVISVKKVRFTLDLFFHDNTTTNHQLLIEPASVALVDEEDFSTNQDYLEFIKGTTATPGAGGKLSGFWASILQDKEVSPEMFDEYCLRFVHKIKKDLENSKVASYFNRGNLRRELTRPTITFKVFIKGLRVIEVKSFRLTVNLTFITGKTSVHQIEVDLSAESGMEENDE